MTSLPSERSWVMCTTWLMELQLWKHTIMLSLLRRRPHGDSAVKSCLQHEPVLINKKKPGRYLTIYKRDWDYPLSTWGEVMVWGLADAQHCCHLIVVRRVDVLKYTVSCQLHLQHTHTHTFAAQTLKCSETYSDKQWHTKQADHLACRGPGSFTWDRPRWTEAVSEMYMIFPSEATTNTKPSRVWGK